MFRYQMTFVSRRKSVVSFLSFSFINLFSWSRVYQWANILLETSIFLFFIARDISSSSKISLKVSQNFYFFFFSNTTLIFFFSLLMLIKFYYYYQIAYWIFHIQKILKKSYILIFIFKLYNYIFKKNFAISGMNQQFWHNNKNYWVVGKVIFFHDNEILFLIVYTYFNYGPIYVAIF